MKFTHMEIYKMDIIYGNMSISEIFLLVFKNTIIEQFKISITQLLFMKWRKISINWEPTSSIYTT